MYKKHKKKWIYGLLTAILLSIVAFSQSTMFFRGAVVDLDFGPNIPETPLIARSLSLVNTSVCDSPWSGIDMVEFPSAAGAFPSDVCINHITTLSQNLRTPLIRPRANSGGVIPLTFNVLKSDGTVVDTRVFNLSGPDFMDGKVVVFNWDGSCIIAGSARSACQPGEYKIELSVDGSLSSTNIVYKTSKAISVETFDDKPVIGGETGFSLGEMNFTSLGRRELIVGNGAFELKKIDRDLHEIKVPYSRSNRMFSLENMNRDINEDIHIVYGIVKVNENYVPPAPVKRIVTTDLDENISIRPSFDWKLVHNNQNLISGSDQCTKYWLDIYDESNNLVASLGQGSHSNLKVHNLFTWDNPRVALEYDTTYTWYIKNDTGCFNYGGPPLATQTELKTFTTESEPVDLMDLIDGYTSVKTDNINSKVFLEWNKQCSPVGLCTDPGDGFGYYVLAMVYNNYNKYLEFARTLERLYDNRQVACADVLLTDPVCNNLTSQLYNAALNGFYHMLKLISGQMQYYLIPIELVAPSLENEGVVVGVKDERIDATGITFAEEVPFEGDVIVIKEPTDMGGATCELSGTVTNGVLELSFVGGTAGCLFDKGVVDFTIVSSDSSLDRLEKPAPAQIKVCLVEEEESQLDDCNEIISEEGDEGTDPGPGEGEDEGTDPGPGEGEDEDAGPDPVTGEGEDEDEDTAEDSDPRPSRPAAGGGTTTVGSVPNQTSGSLQLCHYYFRDEPRLNERECAFMLPLRESVPNAIVTGDQFNGTFGLANLSRPISRQEFFTIASRLYRYIGMDELANLNADSLLRFTDVNRPILLDSANGWWIMPVTEQVARGVVRGYGDGTLRRLNPITGFETGKVTAEILLPFRNDDSKTPWYSDTQELYRRAGMQVSANNYTRGQAFELVYRTMLLREALGQR